MNPHDYFISVDENGEPYLEHALFGKGGQKKDHKYYARAQDKGRWRYFYSPEEFRIWQTGGSKKKVSTSDKMRSAFKQLKETGRKAVDAAADKLGVDERQALQNANAFNRARRQKEYDKTPLGKAENAADRIAEQVSSKVDDLGNKLKTKSERMREELRKKASQAAEDVQEKVKEKIREKAADVKETYDHNKRQFDKAKEMEKAETERQEKLANRPKAHEKPEATGTAKDGAMKRRSMEKSTYGEYKDGDHDFDDANYKEENRVGDSDFFVHKRKDGTNVILEEDMKWVLPKGVDAKSPAIQKAIQDFSDRVVSDRKLGNNYTGDQWRDAVTKAIDEAVRQTPISGSQSTQSKDESWVSEEYKQDMEFNSRKNNYFGRSGESSSQSSNGQTKSSNYSIDPHKVSSEYMLEAGYNSGLDVSALKVADARHAKAQRAYNKALSNPNTSSQEKDRLFRELTKAEKAYYDEADKIADELNQK